MSSESRVNARVGDVLIQATPDLYNHYPRTHAARYHANYFNLTLKPGGMAVDETDDKVVSDDRSFDRVQKYTGAPMYHIQDKFNPRILNVDSTFMQRKMYIMNGWSSAKPLAIQPAGLYY